MQKSWQSFENLKEIVNTMEFPVEVLQDLFVRKDQQNSEHKAAEPEETLSEMVAPQKKKPEKKLNDVMNVAQPAAFETNDKSVASTNPKSTTHAVNHSNIFKAKPKLNPIKSDVSNVSNDSSTVSSSGQTQYMCPVEDCTFSTTKQGLMGGMAASHLSKVHKVKGPAMKNAAPGTFKFKKVKGELQM